MTVTLTVGTQAYTWSAPGDPLPKDYFILPRSDGGMTFHLGAVGDLTKAADLSRPYHLGAHQVQIGSGSVQNITTHWWNSRWTFRPKPLAAAVSPSAIVAARRAFPMGDMGKPVGSVTNYQYTGPMSPAGITIYMPTTGERPDIGLVTDPSALYMLTGNDGPMLAWAQGANSFPQHFRDELTGKPVDLLKYPSANAYDQPGQGVPYLVKGPMVGAYPTFGGGLTPQQAHYCEMSYIAYCATGDETFLENLQFGANFCVLSDAGLSHKLGKATPRGEYRGVSWALRELFMAHVATMDAEAAGTLPPSCHPSSYFKALLDNALAYYDQARTDPTRQVFRLVVGGFPQFAPWQVDYMLSALAFGVLTGHSDWAPLYLWALKNVIDRTSGKSGYPPGYGGGYYYDPTMPDWKTAWLTGVPSIQGAEPPSASEIATLQADPFNGGVLMHGFEYMMTTRAVLVQAQYLDDNGICAVRQAYPDLDFCASAATRMLKSDPRPINPRQSYVSFSQPLPPTGALHMSGTGNLNIGQSAHATLGFDDGHGNASQPPVNLAYASSPPGIVSLSPDASGVIVTGVAPGSFTVQATADNCAPVSISGVVALPLAAALHLSWD